MSVIKSKKSKIGRKFEQKRKAKWVKEKANLVKANAGPIARNNVCTSAKWDGHHIAILQVS